MSDEPKRAEPTHPSLVIPATQEGLAPSSASTAIAPPALVTPEQRAQLLDNQTPAEPPAPGIIGGQAAAVEPAPEAAADASPELYSVNPAAGPISGGIELVLVGQNFLPGASAKLGGVQVETHYKSSQELRVMLPPHAPAERIDVQIENPNGKYHLLYLAFEYLGPPLLAQIEPTEAPASGGPQLRLKGAGFRPGCWVQIGASNAQARFISHELVEISAQPHPGGIYDITLWNPDGQSSKIGQGFHYREPPSLKRLEPSAGESGREHSVQLVGAGFTPGSIASLFGQLPLAVQFGSDERLSVRLPARAAGVVDIAISNPDGQHCYLTRAFEYRISSGPSLSSVEPKRVPLGGPSQLEILGHGFQPGAAVFAGDIPLRILSLEPSRLIAEFPAVSSTGRVPIRLANPDGQWALLEPGLSVINPERLAAAAAPFAIRELNPKHGPSTGGTRVSVRGAGFTKGCRVLLGGIPQRAQRVVDESLIELITDSQPPGQSTVEIRDENGASYIEPGGFYFEAVQAPRIERVTPNRGPSQGGHRLTILGEHFLPSTGARLGALPAQLFFINARELELITPKGTPGQLVDLRLIQPNGLESVKPRIYLYEP